MSVKHQRLVPALSEALTLPLQDVKSDDALAQLLKGELDSRGSAATQISRMLVTSHYSWKVFLTHRQVCDSLMMFLSRKQKLAARAEFCELLIKGTQASYRKAFSETQAMRILEVTCNPASELPWRMLTSASMFMKMQEFSDPYLLDQFTARCLKPEAPINDLADFLHTTWTSQPINFELEWLFRLRLNTEWNMLNNRLVMKSIITLLKSSVRGDMHTYLRLIRRIDEMFVNSLGQREVVVCLGVLAKCKSRQMHVDQRLFEYVAQRCKSVLKDADSKMLFIIGQALSQVNFGEKGFFTLLKSTADSKEEKVKYIDFLVQTMSPTLELCESGGR